MDESPRRRGLREPVTDLHPTDERTCPEGPAPPLAALLERTALSVARRLARGAGRCSLVAYREDPGRSHVALAHGLCSTGEVAVALAGAHPCGLGEGHPEVRLRVDQLSAHHELRAAMASLHALGRLRLVGPDEAAAMIVAHVLPPAVEAAAAAGARVALVATERVLVHGPLGIDAYAPQQLAGQGCFPTVEQEWAVVEVVERRGEAWARARVTEVLAGSRAGRRGDQRPLPEVVAHLAGRVLLADVDSAALTWLVLDATSIRTVVLPFAEPVRTPGELEAALDSLT